MKFWFTFKFDVQDDRTRNLKDCLGINYWNCKIYISLAQVVVVSAYIAFADLKQIPDGSKSQAFIVFVLSALAMIISPCFIIIYTGIS
eukprot:CAMPEP_0176370330 /NCGR_PEP_ID=MMETSP0126-20121128/23911_1 /TAXON_ID=141414 ORGANISM="Strombidinopsis acuminatum, Strain SPMC142" /NCGR_SAMPLE_ID=MMETSP0126 /ASSEMBLY_ACC=CAM_ASM_000229 /LENGTH=87 /DNA_ID=CAMNT_0017729321 /DNA_START=1 /DNA_END=264 /DNA_ORIENTATION=+